MFQKSDYIVLVDLMGSPGGDCFHEGWIYKQRQNQSTISIEKDSNGNRNGWGVVAYKYSNGSKNEWVKWRFAEHEEIDMYNEYDRPCCIDTPIMNIKMELNKLENYV